MESVGPVMGRGAVRKPERRLDDEQDKVRFSLSVRGGEFFARGLVVPISAEARSLRDLRIKLAAATRLYFGYDRPVTMLVGVQQGTPAPLTLGGAAAEGTT